MNRKFQSVLLVGSTFVVLAIWRDPAVAAQDVGSVLGEVGSFLQELLVKIAEFVGGLVS